MVRQEETIDNRFVDPFHERRVRAQGGEDGGEVAVVESLHECCALGCGFRGQLRWHPALVVHMSVAIPRGRREPE